jgi:hypothetical protein
MRSGSYFWVGLAMASAALFGASTPEAAPYVGRSVALKPHVGGIAESGRQRTLS